MNKLVKLYFQSKWADYTVKWAGTQAWGEHAQCGHGAPWEGPYSTGRKTPDDCQSHRYCRGHKQTSAIQGDEDQRGYPGKISAARKS